LAVAKEMQGCRLAYVQSDEISFLLIDYENIQSEPWFDYRVNKMTSIAASVAARTFTEVIGKPADFDARFFNLPENDVVNYFVYRQRDAERNSLNMLAQAHYSQKELRGKKAPELHEMLNDKGVNWNDLNSVYKRGWVANKEAGDGWHHPTCRATPEFSKERDFIERQIPQV
jgi:tRNA(His) guanylyltransferase